MGETGIVVPFGDVAGFAAAFARLQRDESELLALGARARERATRNFHIAVMLRQTQEVYEDVVRAGR